MKPNAALLLCIVYTAILFKSCKKEDANINSDDIRLQALEFKKDDGSLSHTIKFNYDANGKVAELVSHSENDTPSTLFAITYSGNEVTLIRPPINEAGATVKGTVRLQLDANQRLIKRINHKFQEFKAPTHNPQVTFIYDTITYEYDATGLLIKELQRSRDTTWYNPGVFTSYNTLEEGVTNYINNNGNAVSSNKVVKSTVISRSSGQTYTTNSSTETSLSFEYTKNFSNKTDFANAVILNELFEFIRLPFNKHYKNLPDKMSIVIISKNGNGAITSTSNVEVVSQYRYNTYGFIATSFYPERPKSTITYIYNK